MSSHHGWIGYGVEVRDPTIRFWKIRSSKVRRMTMSRCEQSRTVAVVGIMGIVGTRYDGRAVDTGKGNLISKGLKLESEIKSH